MPEGPSMLSHPRIENWGSISLFFNQAILSSVMQLARFPAPESQYMFWPFTVYGW
jgi:hypothetical protein